MTWQETGRSLLAGRAPPWVAVGVLLVAFLMTCGRDDPEPILSDETRAEIERVMGEAARKAFQERDDSLAGLSRASIDTSRLRASNARATRTSAEAEGREADARRRAVDFANSMRDSLKEMTLAYESRTRERDTLQLAYDQLEHAHQLALRAADLSNQRADAAAERAHALEQLNQRILDDVAEAEKGCRILGLVRCPSRKAAFAIGVGVGAAGALATAVAVK